jgi:hypothetical protein
VLDKQYANRNGRLDPTSPRMQIWLRLVSSLAILSPAEPASRYRGVSAVQHRRLQSLTSQTTGFPAVSSVVQAVLSRSRPAILGKHDSKLGRTVTVLHKRWRGPPIKESCPLQSTYSVPVIRSPRWAVADTLSTCCPTNPVSHTPTLHYAARLACRPNMRLVSQAFKPFRAAAL